ncbi:MAG TPA: hypothetical protein VHZ26_04995 [Caulobacteraceae bacterium]|nr:hypothetical protein [Caulobacteraceae bacterium]
MFGQLAAWIVGIGLLLVGVHLFLTPHDWASLYPRDLKVYQAAIDAFAAGEDPYQQARHAHGLIFTGPPFVWELYRLLAHSGLKADFASVLLAADALSVVALPVILSRLLLGPGLARIALGAGFYFVAFDGSGFFTALVINNGTPLYALIAVGLIPAVARGRWLGFHLAVALATAFKPFYAAFWIVPLLADGPWGGQLAASAAAFAAAALTYLAPALLAPKLMAAWLHSLTRQTLSEGLLGDNLLGALSHGPAAHQRPLGAYEAQLAFSAILLAAAFGLGRFERTRRIAALMLIAVFLNPRAMRYDLSTAAIPLLAVVAGIFFSGRPGPLAQAVWAVLLALVMTLFSQNTTADGVLYAGLVVAALLGAIVASYATPAADA